MKVLILLLEGEGEVVSREQMFAQVWPNQTVSDEVLTKCVSDIRRAFSKLAPDTDFIRTVPKKGYQWLVPLDAPGTVPSELQKKPGRLKPGLLLFGVVILLVSTLILWNEVLSPGKGQSNILLMPFRAETAEGRRVAAELEDRLRAAIVQSEAINLLSLEMIQNSEGRVFYHPRQQSSSWVIEGRVRSQSDGMRISMSLVDSETAIVVLTQIDEVVGNSDDVDRLSREFVKNTVRVLSVD